MKLLLIKDMYRPPMNLHIFLDENMHAEIRERMGYQEGAFFRILVNGGSIFTFYDKGQGD